jgi:multidrug efflux system outer membrane protein
MKALRDQAQLQYQRTALSAFVDVSNALVSRRKYAEASAQDARQVAALRIAVGVVRERYVGGVSTYIEVLDAQQELFPRRDRADPGAPSAVGGDVQLYKALGGGWVEGERSPEVRLSVSHADLRNP